MGFIVPIAMAAASVFSAVSAFKGMSGGKKDSPPPLAPLPTAPTEAGASAKAQAEVDKRRRISLLSGGETNLTKGMATVGSENVGKKSLLGA